MMSDIDNTLLKKLEKATKAVIARGDDPEFIIKRIPTGIKLLDNVLGGGLPIGRTTLFYGPFSSCKTFVAQQVMVQVQAAGGTAVYIDVERSYDPVWFATSGVDIAKLIVIQPFTGEETVDIVIALLEANAELIVLDSLAAMMPAYEGEHSAGESSVGMQARIINRMWREATPKNKNSILLLINQERVNIGAGKYGIEYSNPGGKGKDHMSSVMLHFSTSGKEKDDKGNIYMYSVNCFQEKNKVGGQHLARVSFPFYLNGHIDNAAGLVQLGVDCGAILKKGPFYTFNDVRYHGQIALKDALNGDNELFEKLQTLVNESEIVLEKDFPNTFEAE